MNPETKDCPICRNPFSEDCIECQATQYETDTSPQECLLALGKCQHVYHNHCINRWLESRESCPLCNGKWELEKLGKISI